METTVLFDRDVAGAGAGGSALRGAGERSLAAPRLRRPDRRQVTLEPCCLENRLAGDHAARTVWAVVERLDLSAFYAAIEARGSDPHSRAIVGLDVTNHGTDHGEDAPLREQVERRTGRKVEAHLLDGGSVKRESIEETLQAGVAIYAPLPATGKGGAVCTLNPTDAPGVAAWRQRMISEAGRKSYKERAATSETVNADLKTFRGLGGFAVRGLQRVRCAALGSALAYNVMHFAAVLTGWSACVPTA